MVISSILDNKSSQIVIQLSSASCEAVFWNFYSVLILSMLTINLMLPWRLSHYLLLLHSHLNTSFSTQLFRYIQLNQSIHPGSSYMSLCTSCLRMMINVDHMQFLCKSSNAPPSLLWYQHQHTHTILHTAWSNFYHVYPYQYRTHVRYWCSNSVHPSRSGTLSKRLNISDIVSSTYGSTIILVFMSIKHLCKIPTGYPL